MRGDGELYSRRPCVGTQKDKYKIAWCAHWLNISALLVSKNPPTVLSLFHSIELQQHPHTFVVWGTAWIPRPLTLAALHLHTSLVSMPIAWRDPRPVHAPRPCPAPHAGSQTYSSDGCCCCHWRVAWVAVAPLEEAETQSSSSTLWMGLPQQVAAATLRSSQDVVCASGRSSRSQAVQAQWTILLRLPPSHFEKSLISFAGEQQSCVGWWHHLHQRNPSVPERDECWIDAS